MRNINKYLESAKLEAEMLLNDAVGPTNMLISCSLMLEIHEQFKELQAENERLKEVLRVLTHTEDK